MHVMLKLRTEYPYCVLKFARLGLVIIWPLPVACGDEAQPFRTSMNTGRSIERYSRMIHGGCVVKWPPAVHNMHFRPNSI